MQQYKMVKMMPVEELYSQVNGSSNFLLDNRAWFERRGEYQKTIMELNQFGYAFYNILVGIFKKYYYKIQRNEGYRLIGIGGSTPLVGGEYHERGKKGQGFMPHCSPISNRNQYC